MKGLLRRPSPALVIACIALFVALGPAAYATHEVINSSDVVDGSLRSADYGDGSILNPDIALNAINGAKVASNSLSGADVNESSLAIVPNANLLDGLDSGAFVQGAAGRTMYARRTVAVNSGNAVILDVGWVRLIMQCVGSFASVAVQGPDSQPFDVGASTFYNAGVPGNVGNITTNFDSRGGRDTIQVGQAYRPGGVGFPRQRIVTFEVSGKAGDPCRVQAQALAQG